MKKRITGRRRQPIKLFFCTPINDGKIPTNVATVKTSRPRNPERRNAKMVMKIMIARHSLL